MQEPPIWSRARSGDFAEEGIDGAEERLLVAAGELVEALKATEKSAVGRRACAARGARWREVAELVGRHVEHVRQGRQHGGVLCAAPVSSSADGSTMTTDDDLMDRPTRVTYPDGTYEQLTYDRLDLTARRDGSAGSRGCFMMRGAN